MRRSIEKLVDPNMQFGPVTAADLRDAMRNLDVDDSEWTDEELMEMVEEEPELFYQYF